MAAAAWVLVGASVATLLLAAKAHGRQLLLVREAAGFHDVAFAGDNPPFVVALWRADRRRYWSLAGAFAVLFGVGLALLRVAAPGLLLAVTLWAPTAAFAAAGLAVSTRSTLRANAGWWTAVLAAAAAVGGLAVTVP